MSDARRASWPQNPGAAALHLRSAQRPPPRSNGEPSVLILSTAFLSIVRSRRRHGRRRSLQKNAGAPGQSKPHRERSSSFPATGGGEPAYARLRRAATRPASATDVCALRTCSAGCLSALGADRQKYWTNYESVFRIFPNGVRRMPHPDIFSLLISASASDWALAGFCPVIRSPSSTTIGSKGTA